MSINQGRKIDDNQIINKTTPDHMCGLLLIDRNHMKNP